MLEQTTGQPPRQLGSAERITYKGYASGSKNAPLTVGPDWAVWWHRERFVETGETEHWGGTSRLQKEWHDVDGGVLDPAPSRAIYDHSPDGFSWGYGGSGPTQLAIGLLIQAGATRSEIEGDGFKVKFVADVVGRWPMKGDWEMSAETLAAFLRVYRYSARLTEALNHA